MKKLFEFKLTMQEIADYIHKEYSDLYCVFSPPAEGQLNVFVDTQNINLPENRLLFIDKENAISIYLEEVVQTTLEKIYVCGIPAITEVFYLKDGKEWIVETNGFCSKTISKQYSSFKRLLAQPNIDYTRTVSNNVWDIYDVLDIEAARQFLIEEFMSIMEGINTCHAMILVDRMTHNGTISSITRYTMKKEESGPMGKASFEETMDNFLNAAAEGDTEPTQGVSASIICGKRAPIGTGMIKVSIDISMLPKSSDNLPLKKNISSNKYTKSIKSVVEKISDDIPAFEDEDL
jgi:DNA-directed RNA polymerase beta' subunit